MKKIKGVLLLVTLLVLLVGAVNASEVSDDTTTTSTIEEVQKTNMVSHTDTLSQENKLGKTIRTDESPDNTMDENKTLKRNTNIKEETGKETVQSIVKNKQKNTKTASSYDVKTYQELRDALTNINDEYITVNIKDNIKLEDYILIESNRSVAPCIYVTINGEGNTIDGDHQHYFLNIAQNVMVTINNLTVNNCTAAPSLVDGSQLTAGGAIINRDTLILNNTRFNNNHAELYGGAIWNYDNLIVDNSEFNNNTAHVDNLSADGVGQGGAIYGGSLIVNNTRFNNNRAYTGGAISVNRYLIVDNTEFNNNTAESAGAIHTSCTSTLTNTVFNNNVADSYGGAISNGGTLTVNNTQFNNNTVHGIYMEDEIFGWMMSGGGGGAISNGGTGNLTVTDTEFNNNHADNYGGAIDTTAYSNLTVTNSRFNCNTADWRGGAIYYLNASESAGLGQFHPHGIGSYNIADTTFYNNTPANFIIDQDNYIELKENDNYINVSNIAIIVDGEEIYNAPTYEYSGGEFDMIAYCEIPEGNHLVKLIVNGTNIINNEYILSDTIDVTYQGLIDVIEGATMDMALKLEEGLSYNMLETITLDKPGITITIDGNGQTINGMQNQVFHVNSGSSLVLKNITITNARSQEGGAIYNKGNLTIIDSTLTNNQATATESSEHAIAEGGAIYNKGNLTIIKSTLTNNQATATESSELANAYGGAISNRDGSVTIIDSTLTNNQITAKASGDGVTVNAYGGAISNFYGSVTITDTTLNSNSATATGAGNWNVEVNTFGGAIYNTETLTITDSTLENNNVTATATADATVDANALGAATYNDEYSTYNITGTTFYKNAPANIIINETTKKIELINDDYISIGKFTIIADGKEIGTGTGKDALEQFTIPDEYKNVELVINGTDEKTINNRYILRGSSVEVHNYTELTEAILKAQSENYDSLLIYLLPGDYNATKSIKWEESETKNLIINGNGLTLDGKHEYQFIQIGSGLNLTLDNIRITNYQKTSKTEKAYSNADARGGVIYNNNGNIIIINSTLNNNTVTATTEKAYSNADARGGVIYNNNGNIIIINSTLNNNQATTKTVKAFSNAYTSGGVIYNNNGNLTITNATLNNNKATATTENAYLDTNAWGGVIYNNNGNLTITNTTLNNNKATATTADSYVNADASGGVIYSNGALTITNTTLQNNKANSAARGTSTSAKALGGAIYSENLINISDSNFTQNNASSGAAINFNGNTANLISNVFTQNSASSDGETLKLVGSVTVENNIYNSTDISLKTVNLTVNDYQQNYLLGENVVLNFTIELEHPENYDENILEKLDKTVYINGIENVTTKYNNYTLSNLEFGEYSIIYKLNHNISNTVTFKVIVVTEITTPENEYDYYEGIKNTITLKINNPSGEKGTVDISVKEGDKYQKLLTYHNVKDGYTFTTETLRDTLENLYDNLDESYIINITYTSNCAVPSSTEFTLNINKQRNTTIAYDIINNTEGNVQINITVIDAVSNTPINYATIKITGDITQTTSSGIITDTTLTPGSYTINILYDETENYKSSEATINFNVEIDKDKKIEELEEQVENLNNTIKEQNNTINNLNNAVQEQANTINTLNDTIKNMNNTIKEQNNTINNLNNTIKEQNNTINNLNNTVKEQTNTIQTLNNTVKEQNNTINNMNNTIKEQTTTINNLNNTVKDQADTIKDLNNTIKEQTTTINNLNNTVKDQADTIKDLNNTIKEQTTTINNLNNTIKEQTTTINNLNNTVKNQAGTINNLNNTVKEQTTTINTLNDTIKNMNDTIKEQTSTINTLNTTVNNLTTQLTEENKEIQTLNNTLNKANKQIKALNNTNKKLNNQLNEAQKQIKTLNNTVNQLNKQLTEANKEIQTLTNTNKKLTTQLNNANKKINTLNNTNKKLTTQLNKANKEIKTLNNTVKKLTRQLEEANNKIDKLTQEIEKLTNKTKLNTTITINPIQSSVGSIVKISANIKDQNGKAVNDGRVIFKINGKTLQDEYNNILYALVSNGAASINYKVKEAWLKNTTTIQVTYSGSQKYASSKVNSSTALNIAKGKATLTLDKKNITAKAGETITLRAKVLDSNGNRINSSQVIFKLNGKTLTDKNGKQLKAKVVDGDAILKYTIPTNYSAKTYNLSAVYGGSYEHTETTGKLSIERKAVTINTPTITTKNKKTRLKATITDENGLLLSGTTKLAIKIDGKTVLNNVTSKNGKIDVSFITSLKPGMYDLLIISGENKRYQSGRLTTLLKIK